MSWAGSTSFRRQELRRIRTRERSGGIIFMRELFSGSSKKHFEERASTNMQAAAPSAIPSRHTCSSPDMTSAPFRSCWDIETSRPLWFTLMCSIAEGEEYIAQWMICDSLPVGRCGFSRFPENLLAAQVRIKRFLGGKPYVKVVIQRDTAITINANRLRVALTALYVCPHAESHGEFHSRNVNAPIRARVMKRTRHTAKEPSTRHILC